MVNVAWPDNLKPQSFGFSMDSFDRSGGAALGGSEQFVFSPGARWKASMVLPIFNSDAVLAIRALRTQLNGRANATLLPNFDGLHLSWPVEAETDRVLTPGVAQQLDGTYGLDGTAYAGLEIPAAAQINATVNATVPLGSTQVAINMTQGGAIREGQQFGHGNRLHEIGTIVSVVGTVTTVTFQPPSRIQMLAGTQIKFTRPVCSMRCLNMDEQTKSLELLRFATLDLDFIEYF